MLLRDFGIGYTRRRYRREGSRAALLESNQVLVVSAQGDFFRFAELLVPTLDGDWYQSREIVDKIFPP